MKKIMLVSANPIDQDELRLGKEARILEERLQASNLRGKYKLKYLPATRIGDFRQELFYFKPQIVHFTGHGTPDGLIFENDQDETQIVGVEAIANLFEFFKKDIECVMLNACDTEITAEAINQHIPYVIGMRQPISDPAATEFTAGFYDALGAGESYERAFKLGCIAIGSKGYENEAETPVLYFNEQALSDKARPSNAPVEIFISYSHQDKELLKILLTHLAPMKRRGLIEIWSDRDIELSDEWKKNIDIHLNTADIILLLVSPSFIESDYCYDIEMKRAMERHENREARVIPIILEPTDFEDLPFAKLQAAPEDARAVSQWESTNAALYDVAVKLKQVVKRIRGEI